MMLKIYMLHHDKGYTKMGFPDRIIRKIKAERKYRQGLAFQRAGSYKEAESVYREIIVIDPSFQKAYARLGTLILTNLKHGDSDLKNRLAEGLECLNKALEIKPDDGNTLYHLGRLYYLHFEDEEKAFDLFARAIIADPKSYRRIAGYLGRYSYHTKNDLHTIAERTLQLASKKDMAYHRRSIIPGIRSVLQITGIVLFLVFIASFFFFPVCGLIAFSGIAAATILLSLGIIGGIVGVVNAKTMDERVFNMFLCLVFVVIYYRVVLGCVHP
jgi:tetratricopeptide (TPR) repeat protein